MSATIWHLALVSIAGRWLVPSLVPASCSCFFFVFLLCPCSMLDIPFFIVIISHKFLLMIETWLFLFLVLSSSHRHPEWHCPLRNIFFAAAIHRHRRKTLCLFVDPIASSRACLSFFPLVVDCIDLVGHSRSFIWLLVGFFLSRWHHAAVHYSPFFIISLNLLAIMSVVSFCGHIISWAVGHRRDLVRSLFCCLLHDCRRRRPSPS